MYKLDLSAIVHSAPLNNTSFLNDNNLKDYIISSELLYVHNIAPLWLVH